MNQREKEEYLREYARLKAQGKPFFPYAVAKDALMGCVVMAVIITMSLVLGDEMGSKVNAASTSYDARPTAPMPSFKNLPAKKFDAIVNFLTAMK